MKHFFALLKEVWRYVVVRRAWAIGTFLVFLLLLGILLALAGTPYLAPFIYPLF